MIKRKFLAILIFLIIGICAVSASSASDLNETDTITGADDSDELAIADEEVLSKSPGTYSDLERSITSNYKGKLTLSRDYMYDKYVDDDNGVYDSITIEKSITIYGKGHIIYANDARPFVIEDGANVKIYNLTFYGEYTSGPVYSYGGAIWNWGNLYLENCNFINCKASDSGGAISNGEKLVMKECYFENCYAKNEGGALYNGWNAKMDTCYFKGNSVKKSSGIGGAVYSQNDLHVNATVFDSNSASKGGAIYTCNSAWIDNSVFGSYADNETPDDFRLSPNSAKNGASIYNEAGKICFVNQCFFNESNGNSKVEVLYNVIASNSYFEDLSIVSAGVLRNCTTNQTLTDTVNTTGFQFTATSSIDTYYNSGEKLAVTVTSSPNGERVGNVAVELIIDGDYKYPKRIMTNANGVATFKASTMTPGTHNVLVRLYNSSFSSQQVNVPVTVKKTTLAIKVSKFTTTYGSGKKWKIKVTDVSNNKPAANVEVLLKIYTGKKYENYGEKTDSNGIAYFKDTDYGDGLKKGNHKVILSIFDEGYYESPVKSSIKVKAKKLYIAGESNKFKDCGQLILGAYNKEKKKLVSGIKLKIRIYTGKKYKTFNLVTKKSKILGDIGVLIETNAFSAGKHKVTVKITSPNYVGSDKGYIVIPKSAKKYDKFTYVITNGKGKYV